MNCYNLFLHIPQFPSSMTACNTNAHKLAYNSKNDSISDKCDKLSLTCESTLQTLFFGSTQRGIKFSTRKVRYLNWAFKFIKFRLAIGVWDFTFKEELPLVIINVLQYCIVLILYMTPHEFPRLDFIQLNINKCYEIFTPKL